MWCFLGMHQGTADQGMSSLLWSVMPLRGVQTLDFCRCARTAACWSSITWRISSPLIEHFVQCESAQLHERFHQNIAQKLDMVRGFTCVQYFPQQRCILYGCSLLGRVSMSTLGTVRLPCACMLCTLQVEVGTLLGTVFSEDVLKAVNTKYANNALNS